MLDLIIYFFFSDIGNTTITIVLISFLLCYWYNNAKWKDQILEKLEQIAESKNKEETKENKEK